MAQSPETIFDTLRQSRPAYYHSYNAYVDMRGVAMRLSGGPLRVPTASVMHDVADALGFLELRVEDEDGNLVDVLLEKRGFDHFARDWTKLNPSREQATDSEYIIDAITQRREEQAQRQAARKAKRQAPTPWRKMRISHSGATSKIDVELADGVENNMICGVVDGVAVPFDPDEATEYSTVVAVTGPYDWGAYLSGPVLLIPAQDDDGLSVGQKVFAAGPRQVSTKGDTAIGTVVGQRDINRRGPHWKVQFNYDG